MAEIKSNPTYKKLEDLNTMLENAIVTIDNTFSSLENLKEASLTYAQNKVDKMCEQVSERVNETLEVKKQEAIETIKAKYETQLEVLKILKPIYDLTKLDISLDTIVSVVTSIISALTKPYIQPYLDAVKFTEEIVTELTPLIADITANSIELLDTPNRIQNKIVDVNPNLNTDKLNISFTPPSVNDFIG